MNAFRQTIVFKSMMFFLFFGLTLLFSMIITFMLITKEDIEKNAFDKLILTGKMIVNEFEITNAYSESNALALAHVGATLKSDKQNNLIQVKSILDQPKIDGGGVWPLPYRLDPKKEKNAIFFSRDTDNVLRYVDDYNNEDAEPYFTEEWFSPLTFFPKDTALYSKSYIDKYTKIPMITVSVPMFKDDQFFGVSTVDIDISHIEPRLRKVAKKIGGYAFLLDRDDTVFSFTQERESIHKPFEEIVKRFPELMNAKLAISNLENSFQVENDTLAATIHGKSPTLTKKQAREISVILSEVRQGENERIYYQTFTVDSDPYFNSKSFGLVYTIPRTHWKLGLVMPFNVAFLQSRDILLQLILISICITILITMLGYLVVRHLVVVPITKISCQLKDNDNIHISEVKPIETDRNDEIGDMVSTLNKRTQALKERHQEVVELQQEIEETQKEVIFTMGAIGESRSKETGNHVKRVAEYSKLLALYYGMDEKEAEMLKQASPMHDIGKIAIPDAILNKPGRFDEEERRIMDTHAQLGYEMLKYSNRPLLKMAAIVAYEHHEKYDGSGYPNARKGKEIHIYGRITALADVFDALGSDRVYKLAWEDEKIFALFKEERSKHFDPKLIDIFFEHLDEFLNIREQLKDII